MWIQSREPCGVFVVLRGVLAARRVRGVACWRRVDGALVTCDVVWRGVAGCYLSLSDKQSRHSLHVTRLRLPTLKHFLETK